MGTLRNFLTVALLINIACSAASHKHGTVELDLKWVTIDSLNGVYFSDIYVGTPPQRITVVYAPTSSDLFVHNTGDEEYLNSCAAQTPNPICFAEYNNATTSSAVTLAPNAFNFNFLGLQSNGSYVAETIELGGGLIRNQTMASISSGALPFHLLGMGFDSIQGGVTHGTFPKYQSIMEQLVSHGAITSQTQSMWLNPDLGPGNGPTTFPNGSVLFGKLDYGLVDGKLITLPVTNPLDTRPAENPLNWNVAVASISKADAPMENIVANPRGDSCILDATTAFFALHNTSFARLIERFPMAVLNTSFGLPFYQIDCTERFNDANSLDFTFIDTKNLINKQTIRVPPEEVIWPTNNVVPGGSPDTCALAAFEWESYFGTDGIGSIFNCVLGVNVLKEAYVIHDVPNKQVSLAKAKRKNSYYKPDLRVIPAQGVLSLPP